MSLAEYDIRTDLAVEARESVQIRGNQQIHGVDVEEYHPFENIEVTRVKILSKNAQKMLGKPIGTYITIESQELQEWDEDYHRDISVEMAKWLKSIFPTEKRENSVLVVGLGNRDVTADSLGPSTVDQLLITRHMIREYGKKAYSRAYMYEVSSLIPGVMAKTGMETAEIVKGVIQETKPDFLIVIDALAAKNIRRLHCAIQITDTGIHPGSGVGNHRSGLTKESMGIPVIAIGIPMVVNATTIVEGALERLARENHIFMDTYDYFRNSEDGKLHNMYVTAKNIDEMTKRLSFTLSEAINIALDLGAEELSEDKESK